MSYDDVNDDERVTAAGIPPGATRQKGAQVVGSDLYGPGYCRVPHADRLRRPSRDLATSTSIPCNRSRFSPRIFRLATSVSGGYP
jgi:hypothetical protein